MIVKLALCIHYCVIDSLAFLNSSSLPGAVIRNVILFVLTLIPILLFVLLVCQGKSFALSAIRTVSSAYCILLIHVTFTLMPAIVLRELLGNSRIKTKQEWGEDTTMSYTSKDFLYLFKFVVNCNCSCLVPVHVFCTADIFSPFRSLWRTSLHPFFGYSSFEGLLLFLMPRQVLNSNWDNEMPLSHFLDIL